MNKTERTDEQPAGESELAKAVKLLEDNGFYVVHSDTGWYRRRDECPPFYPSALLIQAIPSRLMAVRYRNDIIVDGVEAGKDLLPSGNSRFAKI